VCDDPVKFLKYNILQYADGYCNIRIRQLPIPYQVSTVTQALHRNHQVLRMPAFVIKPME